MQKWKRGQMRAMRVALVITLAIVLMVGVGLVVLNATPQERDAFLAIARRVILG